jgi:hypothetical protein
MILFHSAGNATIAFGGKILPVELSANVKAIVSAGWIPAIAYLLAAILVFILTRGSFSYPAEDRSK